MLGHRFRHRIDIEQRVETRNPTTGASVLQWEALYSDVPADVLMGPGKEAVRAGAEFAETKARITTRWFSGLDQSMRILWDGRTYNIKAIHADRTGRRFWHIACGDEGVNEG